MSGTIKVAFASCSEDLIPAFLEQMRELEPELPLYVVSEFPPPEGHWIPYHPVRSFRENFARCRAAFRGKRIRFTGVVLEPQVPYRRMRLIPLLLAPIRLIAFNENLNNFMLRPRCAGTILRHILWRSKNFIRWQLRPERGLSRFFRRFRRPSAWRGVWLYLVAALGSAWRALRWIGWPPPNAGPDEFVLAAGSGAVAVFPGRKAGGRPAVLVASPYLPFPLSHGGAVRMFNLMRRAADEYDQILVSFVDQLATPPPELLEIAVEVVLVRRVGSHSRPTTARPDAVEEFDSPAFRAALRQTVSKWRPIVAQLEFTQMAQYIADCAPARVILVEHDLTFDLYEQLLRQNEDWELRRQWRRWRRFESATWRQASCVVTMSEKDRQTVTGARAVCLPNGVDLERFRPSDLEPEPGRLLFVGSLSHLPNALAVEFFLNQIWPLLEKLSPRLHIIAGARHQYYLDYYRDRVRVNLAQRGIDVDDFVTDVRPAYHRAAVVIAPLVASAGTNIKILEAMAMGKAVVSTPAGINGLDLSPGEDVMVTATAREMAATIAELLENRDQRRALEVRARETVAGRYGWDQIAQRQKELYASLRPRIA